MPSAAVVRLLAAAAFLAGVPAAGQVSDPHVRVDHFGYRPDAVKTAVLRRAMIGHDAPDAYAPGAVVEVRRASGQSLAFAGPAVPWQGGATHAQSGDRTWWFDFSPLTETGTFFVRDPATGFSSEPFEIRPDVHAGVLRHAFRAFLYQRCGTAKAVPHAEPPWTDMACHIGPGQDLACRSVLNPTAASARDLSGGWHDAGDYNKYVNSADDAVHDLLHAWAAAPGRFSDAAGIPESGNGVPDILDEVRWELDWLLRMRNADGSVLHKVSVAAWSSSSPPSADADARYYAPATASATISACGAFAHGAEAFGALGPGGAAYAAILEAAAVAAWDWLAANPQAIPSAYGNAGFQSAPMEDDAYAQAMNRVRAAAHLFGRTGAPAYRAFFDAGYAQAHLFTWGWASPWEHDAQDALLHYARLPGATPAVVAAIRTAYAAQLAGASHLGRVLAGDDAYRAWLPDADHGWGSNRTKARHGLMYLAMNREGLDPLHAAAYLAAAEDHLHYLFGVNPPGCAFLSNMGSRGSERSVSEIYHGWFADGTPFDSALTSPYGPAPGFVPGGPNPSFAPAAAYAGPPLAPPQGQPILKSWRDWNTGWPEQSWSVTEPHLPYQSAVVRLLAGVAAGPPPALSLEAPLLVPGSTAAFRVGGLDPAGFVALVWALDPGSFVLCGPGWCADLDLRLHLDPLQHMLALGSAGATGIFAVSFPVPPVLAGLTFRFQATAPADPPLPFQSAAVTRTVY